MDRTLLRHATACVASAIETPLPQSYYQTHFPYVPDVAYAILVSNFYDKFVEEYYNPKALEAFNDGVEPDPVIDCMIEYAGIYLGETIPVVDGKAITNSLRTKSESIKADFLFKTTDEVMTELFSRASVRECIRIEMYKENNRESFTKIIGSSRFEAVFDSFWESFRTRNVHAYEWYGSFVDFVKFCFTHMYKGDSRGTKFSIAGEVDVAKREEELAGRIRNESYLARTVTSDFPIHDILTSIYRVNVKAFRHTGQGSQNYGILYEMVYLCIWHLCERHVEQLNKELKGYHLEMVDPYERRETIIVDGQPLKYNRGVKNKVNNAKELLVYIFDSILDGRFSISNLADFRAECFSLGRKSKDGRDTVWEVDTDTSFFIDLNDKAYKNYDTFDMLLLGVTNAYKFLKACEERGMTLVDTYLSGCTKEFNDFNEWFLNKKIIRYMDFLSSLKYVNLIHAIQAETSQMENPGELLIFEDMLTKYAGSEQAHDNKERRDYGALYGLFDNPRLLHERRGDLKYIKHYDLMGALQAVPRDLDELVDRRRFNFQANCDFPGYYADDFRAVDMVSARYNDIYSNIFLVESPIVARQYLGKCEPTRNRDAVLASLDPFEMPPSDEVLANMVNGTWVELKSLEWHLGAANYPAIIRTTSTADGRSVEDHFIYIPMFNTYVASRIENGRVVCIRRSLLQLLQEQRNLQSVFKAKLVFGAVCIKDDEKLAEIFAPSKMNHLEKESELDYYIRYRRAVRSRLNRSIGFPQFIGIDGALEQDIDTVCKRLEATLNKNYVKPVRQFYEYYLELSKMQLGLVELMYDMFTYCYYVLMNLDGAFDEVELANARNLMESLMTSSFSRDNLNWFFDVMFKHLESSETFPRTLKFKSFFDYPADMPSTLPWYGPITNWYNWNTDDIRPNGFMEEFRNMTTGIEDCGERFVAYYNFICTKISFIRHLVDGFQLTFRFHNGSFNAFCCEMDSKFKIKEYFENALNSNVMNGAGIDSLSSSMLAGYNWSSLHACISEQFSELLNDLLGYIDDAKKVIQEMAGSDDTSNENLMQKLAECDAAFNISPPIALTPTLRTFREVRPVNDCGFFKTGNKLTVLYYNGYAHYLHRTGHLVRIMRDGALVKVDSTDPIMSDRELYESVLKGAS